MTTTAPAAALRSLHQQLAPSRTGQGTAIEQSRAVAEVHGAIVVAQQVPRDIERAVADMYRSCGQRSLAERAFFSYKRGGSQISGPSVQLARELARCFGNMQFGLIELRRDDQFGQSEMQAWAWDVQTNTRSSTTFIVEHVRDTTKGARQLTDQRDIYENNANMGARRLREMIFAILPGWFTEDAVAACYETLAADDSGGTIAERTEGALAGFKKLGITQAQVVQRIGAPVAKWTPYDLAQLTVIYRSLMRGETRKEDEFPGSAPVTAAEITQPAAADGQPDSGQAASPAETSSSEVPEREERPTAAGPATNGGPTGGAGPAAEITGTAQEVNAEFKRLGYTARDKNEVLRVATILAGRSHAGRDIAELAVLGGGDLGRVRDALAACPDEAALAELLARISKPEGEAAGE